MSSNTTDIDVTLVDYFAVAGYDPDIGLVVDTKYDPGHTPCESPGSSAPEFRPPLQRSFVAKIINHFPQRRPGNPFSDDILHLCMPRGLRFYTEKDVPKKLMIHTFANIKEDGSRINGTALTFYEEVKDLAICDAMAQLQQDHVREITARHNGIIEKQQRIHHPPGTVSGGTHTLPRNRRDRSKRISYYEGGGHNSLYMSRTICVLSRLPLVNSTRALLTALHQIIASPSSPHLPLESYIYWCLYEVPLPSPSMTLKIPLLGTTLVVQRPGPKELPFFDDSIGSIFDYLPVEKFIRLFSCFLLEHQILLCSKDLSRLMTVCESLLALSFPFRWQMTYAPVLPYSKLDFFEAPVPYVMGWYYEDTVPEELFQSNVCVVDLDTGRSELPEDVPVFPGARQLATDIKNSLERLSDSDKMLTSTLDRSEPEEVVVGGVKMRRKNKRPEDWAAKRMSRSFDLEDGSAMSEELSGMMRRPSRTGLQPLPLENVLRNNSTLARVAEIARRAGVVVDVDNIKSEFADAQNLDSPIARHYFVDAKVNNAIRECVLNRFVEMFYSYEHFVIGGQGCDDRESYEANRESMADFDKASFLSDQPDSHLTFLAAFLETQMFTSFIDSKILSQWETPDEGVVLFDSRISAMRDLLGVSIVRTPTYEATPPFAATEDLISKREETTDYVVPVPHTLAGAFPVRYEGAWPVHQLNTTLLDGANLISPAPSPWRQRYPRLRSQKDGSNGNSGQSVRPTSVYGGAGLMQVESSKQIAQQQYAFVQQLLKETKAKTKRMLVDKMGKEAVQLGHLDAGITGVEENTLVASFCDLLERIWAHGLKNKHGKSSLWNFVLQHQDFEKPGLTTRASSTSMLTPAIRGFRAPSLPPAPQSTHNRRGGAPIDEVPAPIILSPQNNTDMLTAISDIVDSFRGAQEEPWSKSLLRAATSIVEKYKNIEKDSNGNPLETNSTLPSRYPITHPSIARARNQSVEPFGLQISGKSMKKSSSIGDFTNPAWGGSQTDVSNLGGYASVEGSPRKMRSQSRTRSPDGARVVLSPLPTHVAYDLKNVLRMTEIKTDIGYARAFVRLALERKLLHKHLGALLSNSRVLRELYKPYAFVGSDEEKEQFLFHILSLNAAQFRCFTNTFTKTKMDYQVVIVTGSGRGAIPAIWVTVEGSLCSTPPIMLKPNTPLFKFDHKNLGILSTLRIGHQQSEKPVQWFLEYVLVRNEITGQTYKFPCSKKFGEDRWFGNGEDITLERMLVAEPFVEYDGNDNGIIEQGEPFSPARTRRMSSRSQTPQRERSPSNGRMAESSSRNRKTKVSEVEHLLGEAVNALVKYFCSERKVKSELAHLLCGQKGLVLAIEQAFQLGRQESLLKYFRNTCPWDYIERVCSWFFELCRKKEVDKLPKEQKTMIHHALRLYRKIDAKTSLGKDGKFHVFVLLSIRDHILPGLLPLMRYSPVTADMYNEPSFLRTPAHMTYLAKLMYSLSEFNITIDPSLTYGIS
ncbi:Lateral Signaling Target [Caenorhabditis elegans]|uniref:Lateral Signaling Target n=1 Tax=Caenorhabditis elegans TaxID=6239 RepID=Q18780_CAEEL|nr:Lateral Signaling Target [Caenorhabditis elegans]CCD64625.1 Lateral Signaling Target [Caenorhabditis elegans]|eukprot:NP_495437.2 Lateral Signaling Target [Caenorhabditis elegans]